MTIVPVLAEVHPLMKLVAFIFILASVSIILIILLQKGRGGGLGGAFGGGGGGGLLGTKTGDFLTWVTVGLVILFLVLAVVMGKWYRPTVTKLEQDQPAEVVKPEVTTEPKEKVSVETVAEEPVLETPTNAAEAPQAEPQTDENAG